MRTSLVRTIIVRVCVSACVCVCVCAELRYTTIYSTVRLVCYHTITQPILCLAYVHRKCITNSCSSLTKFGKFIFLSFSASWFPSQIQLIQPLLACFELSYNWQHRRDNNLTYGTSHYKRKLGSSMEYICVSVCVSVYACMCVCCVV